MTDCQHEWIDEYYGTKCKKCETFYPYGCAPWDEDVKEGFDFGDDYDDEDVDTDDDWVLACGYPDCCMPGYHYRSECHNGEDIEAQSAECTCTFGEGAQFHLPECPMRPAPTVTPALENNDGT